MRIILIYFAIKYQGDWNKIYNALEQKEKVSIQDINKLEAKIKTNDYKVITILDIDYPQKLKHVMKPPFVLWGKGELDLIAKNNFICLTGNENNTSTSKRIFKFTKEILKTHNLVTGSYKGVDQEVIKTSNDKPIVYILSNGIDSPYVNSKLKVNDILLTEYPPHTKPSKIHFGSRNRIIAAFSDYLVLFNSKKNGGINSLINNFLNLGKEIYCFPGDGKEDDGNSELIKQGANLITSIQDIIK